MKNCVESRSVEATTDDGASHRLGLEENPDITNCERHRGVDDPDRAAPVATGANQSCPAQGLQSISNGSLRCAELFGDRLLDEGGPSLVTAGEDRSFDLVGDQVAPGPEARRESRVQLARNERFIHNT